MHVISTWFQPRSTFVVGALASLFVFGCAAGDLPSDASSTDSGPAIGMDASGSDAGDAGPLELVGLCEACIVHEQCGELGRCIPLTNGEFACSVICNPDIPTCPRGFECVVRPVSPDFAVCAPIGEECCVDQDADTYGLGVGCMGPDCDDEDTDINPGASELCNGEDDDCDMTTDEAAIDCGDQGCRTAGPAYEEVEAGECLSAACTDGAATSCGLFSCDLGADEGDNCATTCTLAGLDTDVLCILAAHCDIGDCLPDVTNGNACDEDSDCESARCDNGFCCDDGICCGGVADCPGAGGIGTTCDDSPTCQGTRGEITCVMSECATISGVPDDTACDSSVEASTCGFFLPIFCDGGANQTPPACPSTCATNAECDIGAHCDIVCLPDIINGGLCDEASDCISGYCNNNVCCDGGDCCRATGNCPGSYSTAPVCDTPSTCQGTRDAATCVDFVCGTVSEVGDDTACTGSTLASMCGLYPSTFCTGAIDQPPPMCMMMCTSDSECDTDAHCDLMNCLPDVPNGEACDETSDCESDYCQNGFCCAAGDCCANSSDCSFGSWGQASTCNSGSTCQGQRRDPMCNAAFQCQVGGLVDDDSGCLGLQSNDCGLYPAVFCTNAVSQPVDQASLCAMSCITNPECDPGAFCGSMMCMPRGMMGDACTMTSQCDDGLQCVDGVCCTGSCTGACEACNVAASLGTCSPVPNNTDPAGECNALSCTSYYWGWSGDQCYRRANATDADVDCNGSRSCQTAGVVCPGQGQGGQQIDCDDVCQTPTGGTCVGTSQGACNDIAGSPPTQMCGIGECSRTDPTCNMGTQVTCMPGSPSPETCNDLDDNCNSQTDEGLAGDGFESNNSCATRTFLGALYTQNMAGQPSSTSVMPTIYPNADNDYFYATYEENDSSCGCTCFLCTDEDYGFTATVTVPANAGSYRLCAQMSSCTGGWTCTTVLAGTSGSVTIWDDGCCGPIGCNDSGTGYFWVRDFGSPGFECNPYTLSVNVVQGCR